MLENDNERCMKGREGKGRREIRSWGGGREVKSKSAKRGGDYGLKGLSRYTALTAPTVTIYSVPKGGIIRDILPR